jgi:hypothetical protein
MVLLSALLTLALVAFFYQWALFEIELYGAIHDHKTTEE